MANRTILTYPDSRLRKISSKVEVFDSACVQEVKDLVDTLEVNRGAGLAAPQVGISKRFLLINTAAFEKENPDPLEFQEKFILMINPVTKLSEEKINWPEACLSVKEAPMTVVRSRFANVIYQNLEGEEKSLDLDWPLSAALQHEYDHLDGVLYIDRISNLEKNRLSKARKKRARVKKMIHEKLREEDILETQGPTALRKHKMQKSGKLLSVISDRKKKKRTQTKASKKKNRRK